jgi:hypothetical protein
MGEACPQKAVGMRGETEKKNRQKTEQKTPLRFPAPAFTQAVRPRRFSDFRHIPASFRRKVQLQTVYHTAEKKTREAQDSFHKKVYEIDFRPTIIANIKEVHPAGLSANIRKIKFLSNFVFLV